MDVDATAEKLEGFLRWRADVGDITEDKIAPSLASNAAYVHPHLDKEGRAVIVVEIAKHMKDDRDLDSAKLHAVWAVEKCLKMMEESPAGSGASMRCGTCADSAAQTRTSTLPSFASLTSSGSTTQSVSSRSPPSTRRGPSSPSGPSSNPSSASIARWSSSAQDAGRAGQLRGREGARVSHQVTGQTPRAGGGYVLRSRSIIASSRRVASRRALARRHRLRGSG